MKSNRDRARELKWAERDTTYKHGSSKKLHAAPLKPKPKPKPAKKRSITEAERRRKRLDMRVAELNMANQELTRYLETVKRQLGDQRSYTLQLQQALAEAQLAGKMCGIENIDLLAEIESKDALLKSLREGLPTDNGIRRLRIRR